MPENKTPNTAPDQRLRFFASADAVNRLTDVVAATRPLDEQIGEISTAAEVWRLCGGDETLARRWVLASEGDPQLVARCVALGLEPEQLGRLEGSWPGRSVIDTLEKVDDQELLAMLARRPAPAWCTCGWDEWAATEAGWTCPHCRVEVRRDPRE